MLAQFAQHHQNPMLTPVIRRISAPLRVTVRGRDGVGRTSVAAALTAAGVKVGAETDTADVDVVVVAESLKPEERASLCASDRPTLAVLNKADLLGFGPGGPLVVAHRRAALYRELTGVPAVPMVALLATADVDDELISALQLLVSVPGDLTSTDAFTSAPHPVPGEIRHRLLATLDRFGIAHAVLSIGDGADATQLRDRLRELSQVDQIVDALQAVGAPVRYRRLRSGIIELSTLATQSNDEALTGFLSDDDTVLAIMAAAVAVVESAGARVDRADDRASHLRRAVHWRRYGRGPVNALHRQCAADICRGSLRLLPQAR